MRILRDACAAALCFAVLGSTSAGQWTAIEDFDLTERSFRFLVKMAKPKEASVDIAVSKMLADRSGRRVDAPGGDSAATTAKSGLVSGDDGFYKFDSGGWTPPSYSRPKQYVETYPCGFSYEVDAKGSALVVEIRPLFELPSGKLVAWTAAGGDRHLKRLRKQLVVARSAKAAIGNLRTAAQQAERQFRSQSGNFAHAGNLAIKAKADLAKAERLAKLIDPLTREISAAELLGMYSSDIARDSKLFVAVNYRGKVLPLDNDPAQAGQLAEGAEDGWREWASPDGKYRFRAKLVSLSDDHRTIVLRGEDKTVTVPLGKLCTEDRNFVQRWYSASVADETKSSDDETKSI